MRWWRHLGECVSPDGRLIAWRDPDEHLCVADVVNDVSIGRWLDAGDEHDEILWMDDSRHWIVLGAATNDRDVPSTVRLFDVRRPGRGERMDLPRNTLSWRTFPIRGGALVSYQVREDRVAVSVRANLVRLSPRPRVLRRFSIRLPFPATVRSAVPAPGGDRVAWVLDRNGSGQLGVWLSKLEGGPWTPVGTLGSGGDANLNLNTLSWTPDGRNLTMVYRWAWRVLPLTSNRNPPAASQSKQAGLR